MTSTTETSIVKPITRESPTYFSMSQVPESSPPTTSWTAWLTESQTPAVASTDQMMNTETTVTTPKAIASRNAVFMTDHGSIRVNRSRARRAGFLVAGARVADPAGLAGLAGFDVPLFAGGVLGRGCVGRGASALRVAVVSAERSVIRPRSLR